ncbi:Outer-membrane lipoproteins carrier protein [Mycetohabitans rhizoxinica HKI 454]|uniref:Outer-membrane lipoprotein carrier protein n=2 Tax=Burkholderiaceae TaxID=119060 RepID=E5ANI0_MYCRK|nr:Outer-membrane lipoproteins carrier protein [Mycetohabitans rhizoxinica HKI 454]
MVAAGCHGLCRMRYVHEINTGNALMMGSLFRATRAAATGALIALAAVPCAHASGTAQLKAFVAQVRSADGEFVQRQVKAAGGSASQAQGQAARTSMATSSGTFRFARPGRFVWAYQKPYEQLLQSDGDKLYVWDKDLNQVTARALNGVLGASPAAILFGSNDLEKNFTLRDAGVKQGIDWLELVPKSRDTQFERVGIGFRDGNLEAMELHDVFGNVTLLTFSNIHKNPALPANTFKFTVPKGADVING